MSDPVQNKTATSILWSAIERFSVQGVQFILGIVIARMVAPFDYGLIAMLGIFLAIAHEFIDSGLSYALIQKQDRTETDYATVFYFILFASSAAYLLLYILSPYIASFYNEPGLTLVARVIGLNLIIISLAIIHRTRLMISLDFKRQAAIALTAVVISGFIGVYLAYAGFGVWALVFQVSANNVLNTLLLYIYSRWFPRHRFSFASFRDLFSFGSKLLAGGLLQTLYTNLYALIIGRFYAATDLGYFNRANSFAHFPTLHLALLISRVTYPIECQLQDDDKALQKQFFLFLRMTAFVVFPLMIALSVTAEPLIRLVLTDKWLPSVPFFRIMCLAYMWYPVQRMCWELLNVKHRSDYFLRSEIIKKVFAAGILLVTISGGVGLMCWGLVVYAFVDVLITSLFTKKILPEITFTKIMREIFPSLALSAGMGVGVFSVVRICDQDWARFGGGLLFGIVFYVGLAFLFNYKETVFLRSFWKNRQAKERIP